MRWASKTGSYQSIFGKDLAVIVFIGNLSIVLGFGFWVLDLLPWQNLDVFQRQTVIFFYEKDGLLLVRVSRAGHATT